MGLTDTPGGAAGSGMYAALFGIGFFLGSRNWIVRGVAIGSIIAGLFCIYLSQVRSIMVMCGISVAALAYILARRGDGGRLTSLAILLPVVIVPSFLWASAIGGDATVRRMQTLTADSAGNVYYKNRGHFLEATLNELLPKYPLGAGLGRWGMMYGYFGDKSATPGAQPHLRGNSIDGVAARRRVAAHLRLFAGRADGPGHRLSDRRHPAGRQPAGRLGGPGPGVRSRGRRRDV